MKNDPEKLEFNAKMSVLDEQLAAVREQETDIEQRIEELRKAFQANCNHTFSLNMYSDNVLRYKVCERCKALGSIDEHNR